MFRFVIVISLYFISSSLLAQPCDDVMRKERGGNIETKHQRMGMVLTNRMMFYLRNEGDENELVFYSAKSQGMSKEALLSAGAQSGLSDSVRIDFRFRSAGDFTLRCSSSDAELEPMSLRGAANNHYPMAINDELLVIMAEEQVKEYRVFIYREKQADKLDAKEWKRANAGEARQLMNGAKCFMEAVE